jgi:zinc protease
MKTQNLFVSAVLTFTVFFSHALLAMELPPIEKEKLNNGLEIVIVRNSKLPLMEAQLVFKVSRPDLGFGEEGKLNLLTDVMMEGSEKLSPLAVKKKLDDLAADLDPSIRADYFTFASRALSSSGTELIKLLSEIVLHPRLAKEDLDRVRSRSIAILEREKEQANAYISRSYLKYIFGTHPYSYSYKQHQKNLEVATVESLKSMADKVLTPKRAMLVLSGDIKPEVIALAKEIFGQWQSKSDLPDTTPSFEFSESPGTRLIHKKGLQQSQIILGHLTIPMSHPDYLPLTVGIESLGGSFDGRLFKRVRTELGLTYGISGHIVNTRLKGNFRIVTFTKNSTVAQVVNESKKIYSQFVKDGITQKELDTSRNQMLGQFPESIETIFEFTRLFNELNIFGMSPDYIVNYTKTLQSITLDQVNAAIKKHLSDKNLRILIYSDKDAMGDQVKELNAEVIPVSEN